MGKFTSDYSDEEKKDIIENALEYMANGKSLKAFCDENGLANSTVYRWITDETCVEKSALMGVRELGTLVMADEAREILDKATPENIQVAKAQADIRLRLAGIFNRAMFGERTALDVTAYAMPDLDRMSEGARAEYKAALLDKVKQIK